MTLYAIRRRRASANGKELEAIATKSARIGTPGDEIELIADTVVIRADPAAAKAA